MIELQEPSITHEISPMIVRMNCSEIRSRHPQSLGDFVSKPSSGVTDGSNYTERPMVAFARIGKAINEGLEHDLYRNQGKGVKSENTRLSRRIYRDDNTRPSAPPAVALTASS